MSHLAAPLDTVDESPVNGDTTVAERGDGADLVEPGWTNAALAGFPRPAELGYTRYTNDRFGYSLAYPDTLLTPGAPIGDGRGMEFVSSLDGVSMIVYAVDESSREDLEAQYQAAMRADGVEVTYSARDDDFYVVSGRREDVVFYENARLDDGIVRTLRMQYPVRNKDYFDAVTTLIASSFEG